MGGLHDGVSGIHGDCDSCSTTRIRFERQKTDRGCGDTLGGWDWWVWGGVTSGWVGVMGWPLPCFDVFEDQRCDSSLSSKALRLDTQGLSSGRSSSMAYMSMESLPLAKLKLVCCCG